MRQGRRVLFMDFTIFRTDGRRCVYRRCGEHFADAYVDERYRFAGGSAMVVPGRVAQSVGHLTLKSGVLGSIPGPATYFRFSFR